MENASVPVGAGSPAITMVDLPPQSRAVVAAMCLSEDRVMATRRMPVDLQRTQDRAPPARRIAVYDDVLAAPSRSSAVRTAHRWQASSHICCNVPMPDRP